MDYRPRPAEVATPKKEMGRATPGAMARQSSCTQQRTGEDDDHEH